MARLLFSRSAWRWSPRVRDIATAGAAGALCIFESRRQTTFCNPYMPPPHQGDHQHEKMPAKYGHSHQDTTGRAHLLIAVPKKGRLQEPVKKLLAGAGIEFSRVDRLDIAHADNLPVSIVFLPAHDIAAYVAEGDVDLGITGEDVVAEEGVEVDTVMKLGFGKCRLSVQAPEKLGNVDAKWFAGKRIVTSFPNVTRKFFSQHEEPGATTEIKCISGSVEVACGLGLADAIVDLVETGTTMRAAGLREVATVMKSETVLIANPNSKHKDLIQVIRKRIAGYLTAQRWVMLTYNIHRENFGKAIQITPGKRSPTVQSLEEKDWVAVVVLVPKGAAACVMDELFLVGARDILLTGLVSTRLDGDEY